MVRDPRTEKPIRESNFYDPGFVQKQEDAARMQIVVTVVDALAEDSQIEWANQDTPGTREFYLACAEEMKTAGITFGDMKLIRAATIVLGNLDAKALEKAADSFSPSGE